MATMPLNSREECRIKSVVNRIKPGRVGQMVGRRIRKMVSTLDFVVHACVVAVTLLRLTRFDQIR